MRISVLAAAAVLVVGGFAAVWERVGSRGEVLTGVALDASGAPDVAGLDAEGARAALAGLAARVESTPTTWVGGGLSFTLAPSDVGLDLDVDATVAALLGAGRGWNPARALAGTVLRRVRDDEVALAVRWDDAALRSTISGWSDDVARRASPGDVTLTDSGITVEPPPAGVALDVDATVDAARAVLAAGAGGEHPLVLTETPTDFAPDAVAAVEAQATQLLRGPVEVGVGDRSVSIGRQQLAVAAVVVVRSGALTVEFDPAALGAAMGAAVADLTVPAVDARFELGPGGDDLVVVPAVDGQELDLDALAATLATGARRIDAAVRPVQAERSTAWAQGLNVTHRVSSFTTEHRRGEARVDNIHRIAELTHLTVVLPGETYSLNGAVGRRTTANGFVPAPSIEAGEFEDTVGGGVSQYATTLFNAVFFGGYRIDDHTPHSYWFSRYPQGREATLSYPTIDLVFTNDSDNALLIYNQWSAGAITVSLYGDDGGREVDTTTEVLREIPYEVERVDDPERPAGEEEIVAYGITGYEVRVTRTITYPDGRTVEEEYETRYRPKDTVVAVGTAEPTTTTVEPTTTTTTTTPPSTPTSTTGASATSSASASSTPGPSPTTTAAA